MLIFLPFWLYKNKFFFFNLMTLDIIKKIKKICLPTTVRTQHNVSLPSDCFVQKLFLAWQRFFDVILKNYYELHFDLRFYVSLYDFTRPCQIYILFAGLFLATPAHEYSEGKKRGWWELGAKSSHQLTISCQEKRFMFGFILINQICVGRSRLSENAPGYTCEVERIFPIVCEI